MDEKKPKLDFNELIEKIKDKNISTHYHDKKYVIDILRNRNYYYRLISYRKNFRKNKDGYIGLDFRALTDMASIDTYLREYLLSLCLDVEHRAKTHLMTHITENKREDGYNLVNIFKNKHISFYEKAIAQFSRNTYKKEMWNKRKDISIWVFLEIIDFGTLIYLIYEYEQLYPDFKTLLSSRDLKYIKNIRNSCAHNDVYFINVFSSMKQPSSSAVSYGQLIGLQRNDIKRIKLHDLTILFYLHNKLCSKDLNKRRYSEGQQVIERIKRNINLYNESYAYHYFFYHFNIFVDYLNKM